jgi:hypothetical protein
VIQAVFQTLRNSDGYLNVRYLNWNGSKWNWNYNWLDNDFNSDNPAALATLLISPLLIGRGVLFCQLAVPTAQHPADFINLFGYD